MMASLPYRPMPGLNVLEGNPISPLADVNPRKNSSVWRRVRRLISAVLQMTNYQLKITNEQSLSPCVSTVHSSRSKKAHCQATQSARHHSSMAIKFREAYGVRSLATAFLRTSCHRSTTVDGGAPVFTAPQSAPDKSTSPGNSCHGPQWIQYSHYREHLWRRGPRPT